MYAFIFTISAPVAYFYKEAAPILTSRDFFFLFKIISHPVIKSSSKFTERLVITNGSSSITTTVISQLWWHGHFLCDAPCHEFKKRNTQIKGFVMGNSSAKLRIAGAREASCHSIVISRMLNCLCQACLRLLETALVRKGKIYRNPVWVASKHKIYP